MSLAQRESETRATRIVTQYSRPEQVVTDKRLKKGVRNSVEIYIWSIFFSAYNTGSQIYCLSYFFICKIESKTFWAESFTGKIFKVPSVLIVFETVRPSGGGYTVKLALGRMKLDFSPRSPPHNFPPPPKK